MDVIHLSKLYKMLFYLHWRENIYSTKKYLSVFD